MADTNPELIRFRLEQRAKSGANWFYWIAALSLINSMALVLGTTWGFVAGLGVTQVFDALFREAGPLGRTVNVLLDVGAAGAFVSLGYAARRHRIGFLVGMGLYAADALVFLAVKEWVGFGFHLFVLWSVYLGYSAFQQLSQVVPEASAPSSSLSAAADPAPASESPAPEPLRPA